MNRETAGTSARLRLAHRVMMLASRIGCAEPELRGLAAFVRPGDTVIDVGAAHGMYTVPLARLVGTTGRVESFEPHPRQQRTVRRWCRALATQNVTVVPSAVGRERGSLIMRLPIVLGLPIYGRAHLTDGAEPHVPHARARHWQTPITALDHWVHEHGIERVSFIKADVEGFEPRVLDGAAQTIDRDRPALLLEIEERHLQRYGATAEGFVGDIRRRWPDYVMHVWRDDAWVPTETVTRETRNYLFATADRGARTT